MIAVAAAVLFGLFHCCQGLTGIIGTGVMGLMFVLLCLATDSLLPGIALHFPIDFAAAFLLTGHKGRLPVYAVAHCGFSCMKTMFTRSHLTCREIPTLLFHNAPVHVDKPNARNCVLWAALPRQDDAIRSQPPLILTASGGFVRHPAHEERTLPRRSPLCCLYAAAASAARFSCRSVMGSPLDCMLAAV